MKMFLLWRLARGIQTNHRLTFKYFRRFDPRNKNLSPTLIKIQVILNKRPNGLSIATVPALESINKRLKQSTLTALVSSRILDDTRGFVSDKDKLSTLRLEHKVHENDKDLQPKRNKPNKISWLRFFLLHTLLCHLPKKVVHRQCFF
jgi:hypothetical protein